MHFTDAILTQANYDVWFTTAWKSLREQLYNTRVGIKGVWAHFHYLRLKYNNYPSVSTKNVHIVHIVQGFFFMMDFN